ncbi:MAG: c-type cytochrome [Verrucomicrobia bacterium]|nr:c-type cytochrome [Verrucomicrobiota bacterium]
MKHIKILLLNAFLGILVFATSTSGLGAREATPAESLTVLPGFKVELLKSAETGEGSWVSMTIDPKGRLIISPQNKEPMLRLTLDASGHVAKLEKIDLPVRGAMGLLYANDSLYVNGQGDEGYHLYRLRDTNGDDQFDSVELLRKWQGGNGEHGAHGIVLGPDKKLYTVCGNFVGVPTDLLPSSPHKNYADDIVLPRAEDGNGFGAGKKPPGGFVLRMDLDGKNAELFASGERNTYDIAFNSEGELFGFDSDMEWDWGMPWYRPTRACHLVSGGDNGFREGTAKWPEYYEDSLPPVVNIGIGSPTGVKFGTNSKFPKKYQKAFFMMDWSYGRIFAVHLTPKGATYVGTFEPFVQGKPLNVTDLEFGKDGAMYFTTGGRGTQSGLYRVTYVGQSVNEPKKSKEELRAEKSAADARALRHQLEAFHGHQNPKAVAFAWPHLNSDDRFIRYAARIAVESQPVAEWKDKALTETKPTAALTALLALARYGGKELQAELLGALKKFPLDSLDEAQKLEKFRVIEVSFARQGRPSDDLVKLATEKLDRQYPAKSWPLNRELSQLLIYLEAPDVVTKTLALLDAAPTQEEQIHYLFSLRTLKTGWTMEQRKHCFSWYNQGRAGLNHPAELVQWFKDAGRDYSDGSSFPKFIGNFRRQAVENLTDQERAGLATVLTAQSTAVKPPAATRAFVKEWNMDDLLPLLDQVGKGRSFAKGKEAFAAAQCITCHRFGNEGGAVGPDLTAISSRFTRRDILDSIIEPSKVLSEQYQNMTLTKTDGEDVTGRILEEGDKAVVLLVNPLTGERAEIPKADIQKRQASKLSPMPTGLVSGLSKEEILDLLAYLESGGKENAPAFKSAKN